MIITSIENIKERTPENMTMNKRFREEMLDGLMLHSKVGAEETITIRSNGGQQRTFKCKTCDKEFPSFQALGGHRASHKKPRLGEDSLVKAPNSPPKPKAHECSICGLEFAIGQALGGHMRRHRAGNNGGSTLKENDGDVEDEREVSDLLPSVPVMKKSNSKRIHVGLNLNLSLSPVEYPELTLQLGNAPRVLKCLI